MKARITRASRTRKNPFTTGNPYTGTFRSQRLFGARSTVAVLIIAPSIRFLFRADALLLHAPSGFYESPAQVRRTARPEARSIDKSAVASATFAPGLILPRVLAVPASRT